MYNGLFMQDLQLNSSGGKSEIKGNVRLFFDGDNKTLEVFKRAVEAIAMETSVMLDMTEVKEHE